MEEDGQAEYEQTRQQEWLADQLGTPWVIEVSPQGLLIMDKFGRPVARLLNDSLRNQALAAEEILKAVNSQY